MTAHKAVKRMAKPQIERHIILHSKQIICSVGFSDLVANITKSRSGMPNTNRRRHQFSHKLCQA